MDFVTNFIFITKYTPSITSTYIIPFALFNGKLMICGPKSTHFNGKVVPKNSEVMLCCKNIFKQFAFFNLFPLDEYSSEDLQTY